MSNSHKLKLDLSSIQIETFHLASSSSGPQGTVRAHSGDPASGYVTCNNVDTYDYRCTVGGDTTGTGYETAGCTDNTCYNTCSWECQTAAGYESCMDTCLKTCYCG